MCIVDTKQTVYKLRQRDRHFNEDPNRRTMRCVHISMYIMWKNRMESNNTTEHKWVYWHT